MAVLDSFRVNGTDYDLRDSKAVRFDEQTLTDTQKAAARGNIGAVAANQGIAQAGKVLIVGQDGNITTGDAVQIDDTLAESGKAADAAAVGAALNGKVDVAQGASNVGKTLVVGSDGNVTFGESGVPEIVADALLAMFEQVAYTTDNARTYYNRLRTALYSREYERWVYETGDGLEESNGAIAWPTSDNDYQIVATLPSGSTPDPYYNNFRHYYIPDGQLAYGNTSNHFPIPIPARANAVKVTVTPATLYVRTFCARLVNNKYYTTNWSREWVQGTQQLNAIQGVGDTNRYMNVYIKNSSAGDGGSPITGDVSVKIEFFAFDEDWSWNTGDNLLLDNGALGDPSNDNGEINAVRSNGTSTDPYYKNFKHCYTENGAHAYMSTTDQYPIPMPKDAKAARVTVTPATLYVRAFCARLVNDKYQNNGWTPTWLAGTTQLDNIPYVGDDNRYLNVYVKHTSAGDGGSPITEDVSINVEFLI